MAYRLNNVLVTGGAGFIGSNFVRALQASGRAGAVVTLDRLSTGGDKRNLSDLPRPDRHRFVHGDICDVRLVDELLRQHEIDTIVHFAAESHVDRSIADPLAFVEANVSGTARLLQAAVAYWIDQGGAPARRNGTLEDSVRFHHVSTDEVYGSLRSADPAFTETHRYRPNSPYAASKAGSDHLVRAWQKTYGLPVTMTNCSNNYGPYQHREKLIPTVIRGCLRRQPIPVYGDGKNRRDWLYVLDHCAALTTVIENGVVGETYHVGGECELANDEIVRRCCAVLDELAPWKRPFAALLEYVDDRPGHDRRYAMDIARLKGQLGWSPQVDIETGLRDTCAWYLKRPDFLG